MIRLVLMGGRWYGMHIDDIYDDVENIEEFVNAAEPVILCDDLCDVADFIDTDDITMI